MKKIHSLLLAATSLIAVACTPTIEMLTYAPSMAGLDRGSPMVVFPEYQNEVGIELANIIKSKLEEKNYFRMGVPNVNAVCIYNIGTSREILDTFRDSGNKLDRVRVTLTGRLVVTGPEDILHSRTISVTDTGSIYNDSQRDFYRLLDYEEFADNVVADIVPHSYIYEVEIEPAKGNSMLEHAAECCADGDWEQGRFLAENSLTVFPNDPEGYYLLGMIARQERNFDEARDFFRKAADISYAERYSKAITDTNIIEQNEALVRKQMNGAPMPK